MATIGSRRTWSRRETEPVRKDPIDVRRRMSTVVPSKRSHERSAGNDPGSSALTDVLPITNELDESDSPSDVEDDVEEYHFTQADYPESDEFDSDDIEGDAASDDKSIISLSSDISEGGPSSLPLRPWKDFTREARIAWETMYTHVSEYPMGGSWEVTEDYQRTKDSEMMNYLQDFPLDTWIIPREQAQGAWFRLHERNRRRSLGIRVFYHEHALSLPTSSSSMAFGPQAYAHLAPTQARTDLSGPRGPNHDYRMVFGQKPPANQRVRAISSHIPYESLHTKSQSPGIQGFPQAARHTTSMDVSYPPHNTHHKLHGIVQDGSRNKNQDPHRRTVPRSIRPMIPELAQAVNRSSLSNHGQTPDQQMTRPEQFTLPTGALPSATPASSTRASTPPYAARPRPDEQRLPVHKKTRRNLTKLTDHEEYPWCREINFKQARATAAWDDTFCDKTMLQEMDATRAQNSAIIAKLDSGIGEKHHTTCSSRKVQAEVLAVFGSSPPALPSQNISGRKVSGPGGDPYHSGNYAFATTDDEQRALALGKDTPEDLIDAAEAGLINLESVLSVKIVWSPGKRAPSSDLRQAVFSVRDTVLTRKQLRDTPILTIRAAECIIDFCPDLLWRSMLLRVLSEAGFGNKAVRERLCRNGCYCDRATITKRVSAALGQKQIQRNSNAYTQDEWTWYDENVRDFSRYIDFFGKRKNHRTMAKTQVASDKSRIEIMDSDAAEEVSLTDPVGSQ